MILPDDAQKVTFSEALALLYRGWTVMWYTDAAPPTEIQSAAAYVEALPESTRIVLAPWPTGVPARTNARIWTYTAWQYAQGCATFSPRTAEAFRAAAEPETAPGIGLPLNEPGPPAVDR